MRRILPLLRAAAPLAILSWVAPLLAATPEHAAIDRYNLVSRNNPVVQGFQPGSALSLGNGQFAFTADTTGLQTFADAYYEEHFPLTTMARWAWHTNPNPEGYKLADANRAYTAWGKKVEYPMIQSSPAGRWLRENPHNLPLARLGFDVLDVPGGTLKPEMFREPSQMLDLWRGMIVSHYTLLGRDVSVVTIVHPEHDLIAVRVTSSLLSQGRLGVRIAFPRGFDLQKKNTPDLDWSLPDSYKSEIVGRTDRRVDWRWTRDDTHLFTSVEWTGTAEVTEVSPHVYRLAATGENDVLEFVVAFSPEAFGPELPDFPWTRSTSAKRWERFWSTGGAIDFSGSTDPRAAELERRVVLSQYLIAIQFLGDFPPSETGLTCSSWYGKHHTEMLWWHLANAALWGRDEQLANALRWYQARLPVAKELARTRGLAGARWPKMVGPEARESPGGNPLIAWNQPHVVYLAELLYRNHPSPEVLERYRELVDETATCLASMLHWDEAHDRYVLGPPLWISQEIYDQATSMNPTYELSYWRFALETAQRWRERLGQTRSKEWDHCLQHLSALPQKDGKYVALESQPDTFDNIASRSDHPTMLAPLGMLPGVDVDRPTMRRTLDAVLTSWDWKTKIWGWDYPMIAMTATRLGDPKTAVDILLRDGPNNTYTFNGHCPQTPDLACYLPANGALLSAVALMAAGWDGNATDAPGFPKDGTWKVRWEGLKPLP